MRVSSGNNVSKKLSRHIRVTQNEHEKSNTEDSGVVQILTEDSLNIRPVKIFKEINGNGPDSQPMSPGGQLEELTEVKPNMSSGRPSAVSSPPKNIF